MSSTCRLSTRNSRKELLLTFCVLGLSHMSGGVLEECYGICLTETTRACHLCVSIWLLSWSWDHKSTPYFNGSMDLFLDTRCDTPWVQIYHHRSMSWYHHKALKDILVKLNVWYGHYKTTVSKDCIIYKRIQWPHHMQVTNECGGDT